MNTENTESKLQGINGPCREKVWPERNDQEKLEALRAQVAHLTAVVHELRKTSLLMEKHQHGANGILLVGLSHADDSPRRLFTPMSLRDMP